LLALYYDVLLRHARGLRDAKDFYAYNLIQENKERMFPKTFEYECDQGVFSKELFGDMLERVERLVDDTLKKEWDTLSFMSGERSAESAMVVI